MTQFATPTTTNTPGELTSGEKVTWRSEMEVPSVTDLNTVSNVADSALSLAGTAISDAAAASANANTRCLDSAAIKTTGAQNKTGVLTFYSFPVISVPLDAVGDQVARVNDVTRLISDSVPNPTWKSLSLLNGWSGTAKYRVVGDYLELWYSLNDSSATDALFATIPAASAMGYNIFIPNPFPSGSYITLQSGGNLYISGYTGSSTYVANHKVIRLAP